MLRYLLAVLCCIQGLFATSNDAFPESYLVTGEDHTRVYAYHRWKSLDGLSKQSPVVELRDGSTVSFSGQFCEVFSDKGVHRLYEKVEKPSPLFVGEELLSALASEMTCPEYFRLILEDMFGGNHINLSYDYSGEIIDVTTEDMKGNFLSSIRFEKDEEGHHIRRISKDGSERSYLMKSNEIQGGGFAQMLRLADK